MNSSEMPHLSVEQCKPPTNTYATVGPGQNLHARQRRKKQTDAKDLHLQCTFVVRMFIDQNGVDNIGRADLFAYYWYRRSKGRN